MHTRRPSARATAVSERGNLDPAGVVPSLETNLIKLCGACGYRLEAKLERCPVDGTKLGRERPEVALLGSYRLVERLGTGGMGVVYRAVHEKLGRAVAIKVLNRSMLADRTNVTRFFQEARSVNTIRHPNVVDIYDFVTAGKDIYMVMEFLTGRDLHQALYDQGGQPFPIERAVNILEQVCGALASAHERNIIHRDLKPANVYLTRRVQSEDFVKLLDFGLAKLEYSEGRMTRDGVVLGTPEYMAPEQARGDDLDKRTDLYAVACLAFHMLTGKQLFAGGAYADVMLRHVKEPAPPLRPDNPAIPEAFEAAVLRCLSKDPKDRPATARALAEELCAAIGRPFDSSGAFAGGRPKAPPGPASISSSAVGFSGMLSRAISVPGRRRRRMLAATGGAAVLALALVLTALVGGDRSGEVASEEVARSTAAGRPGFEPRVRVLLQSTPPGAAVIDDKGVRVGVTPHDLLVPLGSEHRLDFVLAQHHRVHRSFRAEVDTTIAVALESAVERPRAANPRGSGARKPGQPGQRRTAESKSKGSTLDSRAATINPFNR